MRREGGREGEEGEKEKRGKREGEEGGGEGGREVKAKLANQVIFLYTTQLRFGSRRDLQSERECQTNRQLEVPV